MKPKTRKYVADFETTVTGENKLQESTEVWAAALVEYYTEDVVVVNSIDRFMHHILTKDHPVKCKFHNLKFDGSFILNWLIEKGYKEAVTSWGTWAENRFMPKKSYKAMISDRGVWYTITIKTEKGRFVTFEDSLKLLPFTVEAMGKAFETKHRKLELEYEGDMHAGGLITPEQKEYIKNDVLVVKEAMEIMEEQGLDRLTIGSCCKNEYLSIIGKDKANQWFPNLALMKLPEDIPYKTADAYLRKSYKGGWCYLKKGCEDTIYHNGITADVNSLYPSVMISCKYPWGKPVFWRGDIPEWVTEHKNDVGYFVRISCKFYLREGYLPCIQIKGNPLYSPTEWLETSMIKGKDGKYRDYYIDLDGNKQDIKVTLTLTQMDFDLIQKHYVLEDLEILDGMAFRLLDGETMFGEYINKWAEVKKTSKGVKRQLAKLFLNNLYGKFSSRIDNNTKRTYLENGILKFGLFEQDDDTKKAWYIAVGSYCTSHARCFTINAAQANYDHFIYADTDSIHCDCDETELKGIEVHPVNFCCWDLEASWDEAIFVRQKTYIEHVVKEELEDVDPYYNIKCAGMDKRPKALLNANLSGKMIETKNEKEEEFMSRRLTLSDFKVGLTVPGKLMARQIRGGVLLVQDAFTMRPKNEIEFF